MSAVIRCSENDAGTATAWYLLQIKTQQHSRAQENLQNQGFEFYLPMHTVKKIYRRQYISRDEPLFPGYIFVRLDNFSDWRGLQSTKGVTRVVSFNGRPQPVADELIAGLKQRFQSQGPQDTYKPGDKVVITDGCFKHIEAIVKAVTPDERIIVLLTLLNSQRAITMDPAHLSK
jgi:transcriptional antiterminator RfaH